MQTNRYTLIFEYWKRQMNKCQKKPECYSELHFDNVIGFSAHIPHLAMQPIQKLWLQMCEKALQINTDNRDSFNKLIALLAEMPRGGL